MNCSVSGLPVPASALTDALLSVPDVLVVVLDAEGAVQYVNPAVESKTGYVAQDLRGTILWDALAPTDEQEKVRRFWAQGRDGWQQGHRVRTQTGDYRYVEWTRTAVDGQPGSTVGVGIDQTQHRQLEEEVLSASESERRRIGQELHDGLASDLIAATISIENLRRRVEQNIVDDEDLLSRLKNLETSVRQGAQKARSLSHLLAGTNVCPENMTRALSELTDKQEQVSETTCQLHLPDRKVPAVSNATIAGHLYRIAQEALRNAVIHADASRVDLYLDVEASRRSVEETDGRGADAGKNIVLRIRDDGQGVPAEVQEALTRPSNGEERGAGASTRGLGLHLMQYRADLIGGCLTIESAEGEGTTVTCTVPIRNEQP